MSRPVEKAPKAEAILLAIANSNDRFKLLEDDTVLEPNINNPIHPVFAESNWQLDAETYEKLDLTLRLASKFLEYDSALEWFVSPLMGMPLLDSQSRNAYLSDPFPTKNRKTKAALIKRVRKAFECLSHSIRYSFWEGTECKFYARTVKALGPGPVHDVTCTQHFTCKSYLRVDIRPQYLEYLQQHYDTDTLCGRLRNAFLFAATLVHEIAHAIGIMRRNDLVEPYMWLEHAESTSREFGYTWENFMFGCIINPFDRHTNKPSELMRKVWSDSEAYQKQYGKEWASVSMSYIAQWFQNGTWELIRRKGPQAIALPTSRLKIRTARPGEPGGSVLSDCKEAIKDVGALQRNMYREWKDIWSSRPEHVDQILRVSLKCTSSEELQKPPFVQPRRFGKPLSTRKHGAKTRRANSPLLQCSSSGITNFCAAAHMESDLSCTKHGFEGIPSERRCQGSWKA